MKNPWVKKNPFLSMWLSGANAIAGSTRGRAHAEVKRRTSAAMSKATRDAMGLWLAPFTPAPPKKKKRKNGRNG